MTDIVDALKAEANRLDKRAYADRCVGPDCALSSLVAATAAAEIERLRAETVALRQSALQHVKEANRHQARLAEAVEVLRTIVGTLDDPTGGQHVADMRSASAAARAFLAKLEGRS